MSYERIDVSEGIDLNKTGTSKECILKKLVMNINNMFVIDAMIYQ